MKSFVTPALMVPALMALGCGGGGGGGSDDCDTIGSHYGACTGDDPGQVAADCRVWVCTGSKQTAIKCLLGITGCDSAAFYACMDDNGCPRP
jgi:hypothetical protein